MLLFGLISDISDILGNRYDEFFDSLIEARKTGKNKGEGKDLLTVLLNFQGEAGDFEEGKLTDTDIKALMLVSLSDLFACLVNLIVLFYFLQKVVS